MTMETKSRPEHVDVVRKAISISFQTLTAVLQPITTANQCSHSQSALTSANGHDPAGG